MRLIVEVTSLRLRDPVRVGIYNPDIDKFVYVRHGTVTAINPHGLNQGVTISYQDHELSLLDAEVFNGPDLSYDIGCARLKRMRLPDVPNAAKYFNSVLITRL